MLIEYKNKAYISDKVVEDVVLTATPYYCVDGFFTRVGDSEEIKGKYKVINAHNVKAKYSVSAESEIEQSAEDPETEETVEETVVESTEETTQETTEELVEQTIEETVEVVTEEIEDVKPEYTFVRLKGKNKQEQNEICKSLGLKGYHNLTEDVRIDMILEAIK